MDNTFDKKKVYAKYRIERAKEEYETAIDMLQNNHFRAANNRAYYSIFHAIRSVLAFDGFDSKKHSGIIAYFRKEYIKSGIFPIEMSDIIGTAFEIRNASDYDDMYIATKAEAEEQIERAKKFYAQVAVYVEEKIGES
ncbi:MAG: HEPN domain-containing protein [Bacteroides sp.]|nr:HEPN domain-containing protein [Bacteroides sp.]